MRRSADGPPPAAALKPRVAASCFNRRSVAAARPFLLTAGRAVLCLMSIAVAGALPISSAAEPPASNESLEFFEKEIRPLLAKHCYECHGAGEKIKGGLRLTSRAAVTQGGETGPAAVPGKPQDSLLLEAVRYQGLKMPPSGKLPAADTDKLAHWIELGLPWPAETASTPGSTAGPAHVDAPFQISEAQRNFWSFQPVRPVAVPTVAAGGWPAAEPGASDIDRFILAALEARGLGPAPAADRRTLIRRATFDLTGLPPTPDELAAFVGDTAPEAWERVIDRLLASPHYGERWGRHWLDVVRYADTAGETADYPIPRSLSLSRLRDPVIQRDKPYDRFHPRTDRRRPAGRGRSPPKNTPNASRRRAISPWRGASASTHKIIIT